MGPTAVLPSMFCERNRNGNKAGQAFLATRFRRNFDGQNGTADAYLSWPSPVRMSFASGQPGLSDSIALLPEPKNASDIRYADLAPSPLTAA
jgi:hypothetical protein